MQILAGIMVPLLGDLLETVGGVLFLIAYGIYQVVMGRAEAKKQAPQPRQPVDGAAAPVDAPPNQADGLRSEVEDFLRRAQGKPPLEEKLSPPRSVATARRQTPKRSASPRRLVQTEKPKPDLRHEGVAEHVSRHVRSTEISDHAEHLGDEVGLADERMDARLHEKFDHQLGSLKRQERAPEAKSQKTDLAAQVAELLRKPEGMRQLIVAQEILRRPDRW